jgi:hypothetical protein
MVTLDLEYRRAWEAANKEKRRKYNDDFRKSLREWFIEFKSSLSCEKCGESHPACLDFHHRDPSTKELTVARALLISKKRVLEEIEKCDVLCANCHRKVHYDLRQLG